MRYLTIVGLLLFCITSHAQTNTFPADGNVGIGTTSPEAKLHIQGTPWTGIKIKDVTTTGGRGIQNQYLDGNNDGWMMFFGGHYVGQPLQFAPISQGVQGTTAFTLMDNGNIGIGIASPSEKLSIANGNILIDNVDGKGLKINQEDSRRYGRIVIEKGTGTGLGTTNTLLIEANNTYGSQYNQRILFRTAVTDRLVIEHDGNVGIGTSSPTHKLDVLGTIRANEVKVATGWSDFVFEPDYELKSLEQVEEFIEENGHLPDIPSAEEVEENGISLGAMDAKLLQKIEELTLYVLELNKELEAQSSKLEVQDEQLKAQSERVKAESRMNEELMEIVKEFKAKDKASENEIEELKTMGREIDELRTMVKELMEAK